MRPDKKKGKGSAKSHSYDEGKPERPKVAPQPKPPGMSIEDEAQVENRTSQKSEKVIVEKPPKNISSNWTKFEIPSDEENYDDINMSGVDFKFALENAGF